MPGIELLGQLKTRRQKDNMTKRQIYKKTKRQKDKQTKRQKWQKDKNTKRQKDKKDKRQRANREFNIVTSGQFRTLAMFKSYMGWKYIQRNFMVGWFPRKADNGNIFYDNDWLLVK